MTVSPPPRLSLRDVFHPRSVAVFGASEDKTKYGGRLFHYLRHHRFAGLIIPINRRRETVGGLPCYPSIADAPGPIDVALIAVPAETMTQTIRECADAGVGACIIITAGFAEVGGEGARLEAEIVAIARAAGMRLIGPNCMGLLNPHHNLCLTSSVVFDVERFHRGNIGMISQSGALMLAMFNRAHDQGIGFSICASLGNQSDVTFEDIFEHLIDDPQTHAICMYIEGLRNTKRFFALAEKSRAAGKAVLVVKTGRTSGGARAAQSHTASLAGAFATFEAACRDCGVLLTDDPNGMIDAAAIIARWGRPSGDGVGVLSPSGGGAGIAADNIEEAGLRLAALSNETQAQLRDILHLPSINNPIDLYSRVSDDPIGLANRAAATLAADPDVAATFVIMPTLSSYEATIRAITTGLLSSGKPIGFVLIAGSAADPARAVLRELGCPFFDRISDAVRMLKLVIEHSRTGAPRALPPPERPANAPDHLDIRAGLLTEPEAKRLIASYGLDIARERIATSAADAASIARELGFPVALKAVAQGLMHKSDIGGVALDLGDEDAVTDAFRRIQAAVAAAPGATFEGALVSEMIEGGAELIIGSHHDPQFGPVVIVGSGGVTAELMRDVSIACAPVSRAKAHEMLQKLKLWPLLDGYRGRAKLDVDAAAEAISRVSWLAADLGPRLSELDVNPLIVRRAGRGATVVDAAATIAEEAPAATPRLQTVVS